MPKSKSLRYSAAVLLPILLASQGCVSLVFSRWTPEASGTKEAAPRCSGVGPPLGDAVIGLGFAAVGYLFDTLAHIQPRIRNTDGTCVGHVSYYVPTIVPAASMIYGVAAEVVCKNRLAKIKSTAWKPGPIPSLPAAKLDWLQSRDLTAPSP
jgi:hypothetical protein